MNCVTLNGKTLDVELHVVHATTNQSLKQRAIGCLSTTTCRDLPARADSPACVGSAAPSVKLPMMWQPFMASLSVPRTLHRQAKRKTLQAKSSPSLPILKPPHRQSC
eukprot:5827162-Amphidinium_carterae.2